MNRNKNKAKGMVAQRGVDMRVGSRRDVVLQREEMVIHRGPIPSAGELKKYEEILPGAADRILSMAESQSKHRQELEKAVVESNTKNSERGQMFAFIISVAIIVVGFILIMYDKNALGFTMIIGDLVALVTVFVGNRISTSRELSRKRRGDNTQEDNR